MSDRAIAKNRFHKGLTAYLRRTMRRAGISLDEEMAQFALGGIQPFTGQPDEFMTEVINQVLGNRRNLMTQWQTENPKRNPFAPSFPERVLPLVRAALSACYEDEGSAAAAAFLMKLQLMCERELDSSPFQIDPQLVPSEEH